MRTLAFHQCGRHARVESTLSPTRFLGGKTKDPGNEVGVELIFSTLHREVFLRLLRFSPLLKTQHWIGTD